MSKLSEQQATFARSMDRRQWHTLRGLVESGPVAISATECGDPDLYALIRNKFAQGGMIVVAGTELRTWAATEVGREAIARWRRHEFG